jgi:hypothetical protein
VPERYGRKINCFNSFLGKKATFEAFFGLASTPVPGIASTTPRDEGD